MSKYIIKGSKELSGEVVISGNKNAALAVIAATLLTDEEVLLENIPEIKDVKVMFDLLEKIGSRIEKIKKNTYLVKSNIKNSELDAFLVDKVRGSILYLGPLLARGYDVKMPPPGGDVIGLRRLDSHFIGFEALGCSCSIEENGKLNIKTKKRLKAKCIFLDEASVTATENIIMAASLAEGQSEIYNAACEPHIQDLCNMLVSMGVKIEGIGSNLLKIEGTKKLKGTKFKISPDYMEIGSFIGLAVVTNSTLSLKNTKGVNLKPITLGFEKLGISYQINENEIIIKKDQRRIINKTYSNVTQKLDDSPWPGFPADLLSIMCIVATQMTGTILIHEKMFESRMYFIDNLIRMGADIVLCDPHRAIIIGGTKLKANKVISPDIRAGMALVIAALAASGETVIENIEQIERGYENLLDKLSKINADIKKA